jgi:Protein of unknown function (DUF1003)
VYLFGSWRFIVVQTITVVAWIAVNLVAFVQRWDPYPFILLNLLFSTQAAYAAPLILLSQNRQADTDRIKAEHDYQVNQLALAYLVVWHRDAHGPDCRCVEAMSDTRKALVDPAHDVAPAPDRAALEAASVAIGGPVTANSLGGGVGDVRRSGRRWGSPWRISRR